MKITLPKVKATLMALVLIALFCFGLVFLPVLAIVKLSTGYKAGHTVTGFSPYSPENHLFQLQFPVVFNSLEELEPETDFYARDDIKVNLNKNVAGPEMPTAQVDPYFHTLRVPNTNITFFNKGVLLFYMNTFCTASYAIADTTVDLSEIYVISNGTDQGTILYDNPEQNNMYDGQGYVTLDVAYDKGMVPRPVHYETMECYWYKHQNSTWLIDTWPDLVEILGYKFWSGMDGQDEDGMKRVIRRANEEDEEDEEDEKEPGSDKDGGLDMIIADIHDLKSYRKFRANFLKANDGIIAAIALVSFMLFGNIIFFIVGPIYVETRSMLKSYIENETLKAENTRKEKKVSKNFSVLIAYLYVYAKRTKKFLKIPVQFIGHYLESCGKWLKYRVFKMKQNPANVETDPNRQSADSVDSSIKEEDAVECFEDGYRSEEESDFDSDDESFTQHSHLYEAGKMRAKIYAAEIHLKKNASSESQLYVKDNGELAGDSAIRVVSSSPQASHIDEEHFYDIELEPIDTNSRRQRNYTREPEERQAEGDGYRSLYHAKKSSFWYKAGAMLGLVWLLIASFIPLIATFVIQYCLPPMGDGVQELVQDMATGADTYLWGICVFSGSSGWNGNQGFHSSIERPALLTTRWMVLVSLSPLVLCVGYELHKLCKFLIFGEPKEEESQV